MQETVGISVGQGTACCSRSESNHFHNGQAQTQLTANMEGDAAMNSTMVRPWTAMDSDGQPQTTARCFTVRAPAAHGLGASRLGALAVLHGTGTLVVAFPVPEIELLEAWASATLHHGSRCPFCGSALFLRRILSPAAI